MATVKIFLELNETEQEAKETLLKALSSAVSEEDDAAAFPNPAAQDVYNILMQSHQDIWDRLLRDISIIIDEEL